MSNSYLKPAKRKERLERRIKHFDKISSSYKGRGATPYTKPGSLNK